MIHKIHIQLTFLFAGVSGTILIALSLFNTISSRNSLKELAWIRFQSDMRTFVTNCENSSVIRYDWLTKLEESSDYRFFLYDNNIPLHFVTLTKTEEEILLAEDMFNTYQKDAGADNTSSGLSSFYRCFPYKSSSGKSYFVGVGTIPGQKSDFHILVTSSLKSLKTQQQKLLLLPAVLVPLGLLILYVFCYFFTKKLLLPVEESRIRQTRFISAASHELRTPVTTIRSALNAMEKGSPEENREFCKIAEKEIVRLSTLMNDLLSLAGSDGNTLSFSPQPTEPESICIDTYEAFLIPAKEKGLTLNLELPDYPIAKYRMDRERIMQLLSILLSNAIAYSRPEGSIILSISETSKGLRFQVKDDGIGISEEDLPHIFERFYRSDSVSDRKGHFGLGLSIARELCELHHSHLNVESTPGEGSIFSFVIPSHT